MFTAYSRPETTNHHRCLNITCRLL